MMQLHSINTKRIRLLLAALVLVGVVGLTLSPAMTAKASAATLLFSDDFTGPAGQLPDSKKWGDYSTCSDGPAVAWGKLRCGADEKLNGAGQLVIPAGPTYGTGLQTKGKFSFQYGTATAWIKMPPQAGYWPAFWLVNPPPSGTGLGGEIDITEVYTTWPKVSHVNVHAWNKGSNLWSSGDVWCTSSIDLSAAYHKYSARVEPGKITFLFDGKKCGSIVTPTSPAAAGKPWPFGPNSTNKHSLILDLAVGGAGGQQKTPTAAAKMLVGRVEVYSLEK